MGPDAALAPDAAREGWVFDVKRYAVHDGPGLRTAVFLKGCALACAWCHNPESISPKPELALRPDLCIGCGICVEVCPNGVHRFTSSGEHLLGRDRCALCGRCAEACYAEALTMVGRKRSVASVLDELLEDRAFYEASGGGVTLTGGEPLVQPSFTAALLHACKAAGLHTALDTSGHVPWTVIATALPAVDLMLYDLKHLDPREHRRHTGATNALILENLRRLSEVGVPIEIRIPVVPTVNDAPDHLEAIGQFLGSLDNVVAVRLLAYHRLAGSKYASVGRPNTLPAVETPSREHLEAAAARIRGGGRLSVVVGS